MKPDNKIVRVSVNLSLNKYFDYKIPLELSDSVKLGMHVNIPFGNRNIIGCIVAFLQKSDYGKQLKEIISICNARPVIPSSLLDLGEWIAKYYCCSKEQAIRALLPGAVRNGKITHKKLIYIYLPDPKKAGEFLFSENRAHTQRKVVELLLQKPDIPLSLLKKQTGCSDSVIKSLEKNGIIKKERRKVNRDPFGDAVLVSSIPPELTEEQTVAVTEVKNIIDGNSKYFTALLHGVTGSGKTEVYLKCIEYILKLGKEAIVLVPEISLTPQTTERFRSRFGDSVSVLHSGLSEGERFDEWTKVYEGKVSIVIGARSALFAPFRKLGLIIVDEEHENSYKQDEAPRYHARDVAVMRAYKENAAVILGSATPSLESFYNTEKNKYQLISLTKRIDDRLMPEVKIVDMRGEIVSTGNSIFSKELITSIYDRLGKCEQVIIFLNRRGFATHLSCNHCGYTASCSNCSIDYTFHRANNYLSCHICGSVIEAPRHCPECKAPDIKYSGVGTEKIENIASKLFPLARIKRMDSDTMTHKGSYEEVLGSFRKGEIDILIGTQMLAKGLDFPNVTLVGIINADLSLHIPDFRASERTFQLLTQVAGRAGRGVIPGEVYIQTFTPFHSAVQYAVKHDFLSFYQEEIEMRKQLFYPPETHLSTIRFIGKNEEKVKQIADNFMEELMVMIPEDIRVSPVVPSPIEKMKNKFRYCVMIRGFIKYKLKSDITSLLFRKYRSKDVNIYIDIDALNLM
ncbi:MAG: primosomal protein N' [bacterium]|nr:primosomal protein N' [bacterium]